MKEGIMQTKLTMALNTAFGRDGRKIARAIALPLVPATI